VRKSWQSNTGKYEAGQNGHRQNVLSDLAVPGSIWQAKHNMLHLVVDSPACFEGIRLRIRRKVVKVGLEEPKGLTQN
jgi:hypothetical protein